MLIHYIKFDYKGLFYGLATLVHAQNVALAKVNAQTCVRKCRCAMFYAQVSPTLFYQFASKKLIKVVNSRKK